MVGAISWENLAHISQILQLFVVVVGLLYAKKQLDEGAAARRLTSINEVIKEIGSEELRNARSTIYAKFDGVITPQQAIGMSEGDFELIRRLAVAYDRLAFLVSIKILREDDLYVFQGTELVRLWETIDAPIQLYRAQNGRKTYCQHLEKLAGAWAAQSA